MVYGHLHELVGSACPSDAKNEGNLNRNRLIFTKYKIGNYLHQQISFVGCFEKESLKLGPREDPRLLGTVANRVLFQEVCQLCERLYVGALSYGEGGF